MFQLKEKVSNASEAAVDSENIINYVSYILTYLRRNCIYHLHNFDYLIESHSSNHFNRLPLMLLRLRAV